MRMAQVPLSLSPTASQALQLLRECVAAEGAARQGNLFQLEELREESAALRVAFAKLDARVSRIEAQVLGGDAPVAEKAAVLPGGGGEKADLPHHNGYHDARAVICRMVGYVRAMQCAVGARSWHTSISIK